ncbi:uncharacterized protein LOC118196707 [Stegodyphus dumicola]|uniref:uncharacterized protein LOC118196707 n=1 Tax=Stegodyphus dumicola TaxID=202533 RepID=UPI0015ACF294|nr:uncharacterized protein LOC118196707 [Stegodyphus dumicola]
MHIRKKNIIKDKKAATAELTLVATGTSIEVKDENIETAVDNILDDLVGETIVVLNSISQKKGRKLNFLEIIPKKAEIESGTIPKKSSTQLHPSKKTWCKLVSDENPTVKQNFIDKAVETDKIKSNENQTSKNMKSAFHQPADCEGDTSHLLHNRTSEKSPDSKKMSHVPQHQPGTESSKPPLYTEKWKVLSIDPRVSEEIICNRNQFWDYLEKISRVEKGNFNPWILSNMISEVILDECIQDITQELGGMSSSVITALYNQEFLKSM